MEIIKGITSHTIVVVVDKKEKAVGLSAVLTKQSHKVTVAHTIYEALKIIDQELPHLVIVDALLSDGSAGTLYDRLKEHKVVCDTPILVLVAQKTREYLTPLKGRQFAGFLLGKTDVMMVANKVKEVLATYKDASPYFYSLEKTEAVKGMTLSVKATVMGKAGDQIVYRSESEVDSSAALVCLPEKKEHSPALLSLATNARIGDDIYNYFPLHRIKGKGRLWLGKLPSIDDPKVEAVDVKTILFFDNNVERFQQFQEVLLGYGIELVHASSLQMAAALLAREPERFNCVFLNELGSDNSGITFKATVEKLPPDKLPAILVATAATSARSNGVYRFLHKPFGLGKLVDTIEAACQVTEGLSGESANIDVTYEAPANLVGLDETGGIIALKFPIIKGSKLHLNSDVLKRIWDGDTLVNIENIAVYENAPNLWMAKFIANRALGN